MAAGKLSLRGRFDDLGADGRPARLGIMGGTFDPIHIGHLRIAEEVREALGLDGVLFVPAGVPVFKKDRPVADGMMRLQEVSCALAGNPFFDASPLEVQREGDTYTIDTLRELRGLWPENVELVFIVGADAAESMGLWREADRLTDYASVAVATGRPDSEGEGRLRESLAMLDPGRLHFVPVSSLEVSSGDIRERLQQGRSVRYLTPVGAGSARMATGPDDWRGAPEQDDGHALSDEFLAERRAELQQRVGPKRFRHSLDVSATAEQLARIYGVDPRKARLAGLLHDWDKGLDDEGARARVRELGMEGQLDPVVVEDLPQVLHGHTAARALAREFPQIPNDVLQAIDRHTVGAVDMSPLDMVLNVADAIEPGRQFGELDELRAAVGEVDLEELFFKVYAHWASLLMRRGRTVHPDTIRIFNSYAKRLKGGKTKKGKKNR